MGQRGEVMKVRVGVKWSDWVSGGEWDILLASYLRLVFIEVNAGWGKFVEKRGTDFDLWAVSR